MEEKMKRFLLALLISLFVVLPLTAGGQGEDGASDGPVTITWAFWGVEPVEFLEVFNSSQDRIRVEYEQISSDQYVNILNIRLASGEAPDLFASRFVDIYETLIAEEQIVDLTNEAYMANFEREAIRQVTGSDGRVYGFPVSSLAFLGFYNKEIFEEYDLEIPMNWEEYMDVCATLKTNGVVPQIQGTKDLWQTRHVLDPVQVAQAKDSSYAVRLGEGEAAFNDPIIMDGWKRYEEFIEKGYLYEGSIGLAFNEAWEMFCKGEAAIMQGGTWYASQAFSYIEPEFEYGVLPFPLNREGEELKIPYTVKSENMVVNKNSEHLEAVMEFVEWFCQPENLALYARTTNSMSAGIGVTADFSESAVLMSEFLQGKAKYEYRKYPSSMASDYRKAMQEIIVGSKSAVEAANAVQKKYEVILGQ